jgi:flagellar biosynthesis component FlhA
MTILRLLLVCSFLFGCSSVKKIQAGSNTINTASTTTTKALEEIKEAAIVADHSLEVIYENVKEIPAAEEIKQHVAIASEAQQTIIERSDQGLLEQATISSTVKEIIEATSSVKDAEPWWAVLLQYASVAVISLAVVIILWQTGVGLVIRRLIGFIPTAKKEEAKILDEALSSESETTIREAVAMLRAKDPELNEAFKRRKKRAKL